MEKSDRVYTMEGDIGWSDVGSWESVYELSDKDKNGNALTGDIFTLNSKNSYIYSEKKFTAAVCIEDLVIINLEDSLLVCKRSEAQNVKKIVDFLSESDREELI
jgi:mannose-1-phosphate guanylyltransferase